VKCESTFHGQPGHILIYVWCWEWDAAQLGAPKYVPSTSLPIFLAAICTAYFLRVGLP